MREKINAMIELCRPKHYYKNILIFFALFFSGNLLNLSKIVTVLIGFVLLSLMSSVNYIINDNVDKKRDRENIEKSQRPIASGRVSTRESLIIAFALFLTSCLMAYNLDAYFFIGLMLFFVLSTLYSLFLKNEIFLDIITISINFVIRALCGALLIKVWISPWLIVGTFFLALFLVTGKRKSEIVFLGEKAGRHRNVLYQYSDDMLNSLIHVATTTLFLSYALYCFLGNNEKLLLTLPIVLYILLRYLYLVYSGSEKTRNSDKIFYDHKILIGIIIYVITTFILLYIDKMALF